MKTTCLITKELAEKFKNLQAKPEVKEEFAQLLTTFERVRWPRLTEFLHGDSKIKEGVKVRKLNSVSVSYVRENYTYVILTAVYVDLVSL